MNGRYYQSNTNRFLTPDSIVPNPANPQSFNRYSYVLNRPLVLTDPSGHMPSDGCQYEGCAIDKEYWGANFINYLMENTDLSDPTDNPTGQMVLRLFEGNFARGTEDGVSINEIIAQTIEDSVHNINQSMNGWYPLADSAELIVVSAVFIAAAESEGGDHLDGGSRGGGVGGGGFHDGLPGGRGNPLKPDENAIGPHSTYIRNAETGEINHYATYQPNPRNPSGFDEGLRVDMIGGPHYNKVTGEYVETPHVHSRSIPGEVAPAEQWQWTLRR